MLKKIFRSPVTTVVLFLVAAGLLLSSGIGGTQAYLNIESNDYLAEIVLDQLDVGLIENTIEIPDQGDLLLNLIPENESLTLGRAYKEELAIKNTDSEIAEYVRVSVYKYFRNTDGQKALDMDPAMIDLHFVTDGGWSIDQAASTPERTVLYYMNGSVEPGAVTSIFTDTMTISPEAAKKMYAGATVHLECVVDGVQTHNAGPAMISVWGSNYMGFPVD